MHTWKRGEVLVSSRPIVHILLVWLAAYAAVVAFVFAVNGGPAMPPTLLVATAVYGISAPLAAQLVAKWRRLESCAKKILEGGSTQCRAPRV